MTENLQQIQFAMIEGEACTFGRYAGKVVLVVNVASKCGLTPQYEGLEALYRQYREQGLVVVGFPANDFLAQEPGSEAEIADFCRTTYDVTFPMAAKISVAGPDRHPLYSALTRTKPEAASPNGRAMRERLESRGIPIHPEPEILWNFEKFVIDRNGNVVARFAPDTPPDDEMMRRTIEKALAD